jgi:hypothetical protein
MGYQTDFSISFDAANADEILDSLTTISGYDFDDYYLYGVKWYNHEKDMNQLSLLYPDVLFALEGKGEGDDDMWISYYQAGKSQHCQAEIIYPEYNPMMMK